MVAFEGDTGPYLQYAHARVRSIFRRAGNDVAPGAHFALAEAAERDLALGLLAFPEAFEASLATLQPHRLCTYLFDLAQRFTAFYDRCPVLSSEGALRERAPRTVRPHRAYAAPGFRRARHRRARTDVATGPTHVESVLRRNAALFVGGTMEVRAAIVSELHGPWHVETIDIDEPHAFEVKVKMSFAGMCHSDEHLRTGDMVPGEDLVRLLTGHDSMFPVIGGHEGSGVVESVGENVTSVAPGDHVAVSFVPSCGRCEYCASGRQYLCDLGAYTLMGPMISDGTWRHHLGDVT